MSAGDRVLRWVLGATGVLAAAYGGWLLLARPHLLEIALWLAGGVLVHDALLAPLVLGLTLLGTRLLPGWLRAPAAVALVVLGSVTLLAVPVLGRFGARADNPTLLDRPYLLGWLLLAALVLAACLAWGLRARRGHR